MNSTGVNLVSLCKGRMPHVNVQVVIPPDLPRENVSIFRRNSNSIFSSMQKK